MSNAVIIVVRIAACDPLPELSAVSLSSKSNKLSQQLPEVIYSKYFNFKLNL